MPKEIQDPKEFGKLTSGVSQVTIVWRDDLAKVKARVGSYLYTCKMPFEMVEKFLSGFKGQVKEINKRPEQGVKIKKSRRRKAKQVSEGQEASDVSQEALK